MPGPARALPLTIAGVVAVGALAWDAFVPRPVVWAATAIAAVGFAYLWMRQRRRRRAECPDGGLYPECRFRVTLDSTGVTCAHPERSPERVRWSDLVRFDVCTTSAGPSGTDLWWMLAASDGSTCAVPQGATGEEALLQCLLSLPGIDWKTFGAAMASTDNRTFTCWPGAGTEVAVATPS
ncbi:MAG TPA: hypothetical protein VFH27_00060 [Longimicrobiaceae bacterium]|nr:hypothetical protein [Longimicrobiaceae bacterium]